VPTGTTGGLINSQPGLTVTRYKSGPLGGDQQIGALIAENKLDALFFFWDPLNAAPHDPDVKALLRLCSVWNVPVACTPATADLVVTSPWFLSSEYKPIKPSF
jgi:methylglyoxal synthase